MEQWILIAMQEQKCIYWYTEMFEFFEWKDISQNNIFSMIVLLFLKSDLCGYTQEES